MILTNARAVLRTERAGALTVMFVRADSEPVALCCVELDVWRAMGSPETVQVTVEPVEPDE